MTLLDTTSLWLDPSTRSSEPSNRLLDPLVSGSHYDVVVVGAGLTGLTTAALLARSGRSVVVLEARHAGAVTTGNTTAKLSLLQGTTYSDLLSRHDEDTVRHYLEGNREAQSWLLRYLDTHGVAYQRRDAVTYAATAKGAKAVRSELEATERLGLAAEWRDDVGLGYEHEGGIVLADQVQFHPVHVLDALSADLGERGVAIHEACRVMGVDAGAPSTVHVERGPQGAGTEKLTVTAGTVVLATGIPMLDRGGFFAQLEPMRSYAISFRVPGEVPQSMYLSADSPTRSLRTYPGADGDLLLVGGNGHVVGRETHTRAKVEDLVRWTQERFPGAEVTHQWSAQDYKSISHLPFVGPLTPGDDSILVATGYNKWGMTNAVAAGLALSETVLGDSERGSMPWAEAFRSWSRHDLAGTVEAIRTNVGVGARMVTDRLKAAIPGVVPAEGATGAPAEGEGRIEHDGATQVAVCTVEGRTYRRSAACSHLGGIVRWNDSERSWDCPLHGSRFAPDGVVLEGPAVNPLSDHEPDAEVAAQEREG